MTTVWQAPVKGEGRPGYKHTKLGWIPEEWEVKALGKCVEAGRRITYGIVQPGLYDPNGRYLVRGKDYSFGWVAPEDFFRVTPKVEEPYRRSRLKGGDILLTIVGAGVGNVTVVPEWLEGANITQTTARIAIEREYHEPSYFYHYLSSGLGVRLVHHYEKGGAQPGLNIEDINLFAIACPPKEEQRRIAAVLGAWERAMATVQQLLAAQQERKRGLMQELLTGRRRFKGFGGKWKEVRLSSVVSKAKGSVVTSNEDPTGTPVIDAGSYEGGATLYSTDTNALRCIDTDVLLLWDGSKAGRAMTGKRGIVGSTFVLLKPKEMIDPGFLTARLTLDEYKIMAIREGSGIPHVPKDFLHWYKFALPPLDEQRAIVGLLNELDKEAASLKEQLDHLTTQKRGLMQQLLTGAVRVKV